MASKPILGEWQSLFSKSKLLPFLVGATAVSIFSKAIYDLLILFFGETWVALLLIALGSIGLVAVGVTGDFPKSLWIQK